MKKNLDMTEGKPISLLWAFTFPTLMGNLLNQVYSITDSIVVGRYLGQTALAAVGSTMPVILLLAALMIGINVGVGIIISRYFGQMWGDRIFEKCGIRRDEGGDGGKTLEIRGKRRLSARDGGANYQQS